MSNNFLQDQVDAEVKKLLDLKAKYKELTGEDVPGGGKGKKDKKEKKKEEKKENKKQETKPQVKKEETPAADSAAAAKKVTR